MKFYTKISFNKENLKFSLQIIRNTYIMVLQKNTKKEWLL